MAEGKKSFIAYCDWKEIFESLSDEKAGQLIKHLLSYVNDENPIIEDSVLKIAFIPIRQQLKRDLLKYDARAERSRENGKSGGRPKKPKKPKKPSGLKNNPEKPKKPDTVNDTVTVNDIKEKSKKEIFEKWLNYREEIKKPIKVKSTLKNLVKKFNEEPYEKVKFVVNLSIDNQYQGLFWDKYQKKQTNDKKFHVPL